MIETENNNHLVLTSKIPKVREKRISYVKPEVEIDSKLLVSAKRLVREGGSFSGKH